MVRDIRIFIDGEGVHTIPMTSSKQAQDHLDSVMALYMSLGYSPVRHDNSVEIIIINGIQVVHSA